MASFGGPLPILAIFCATDTGLVKQTQQLNKQNLGTISDQSDKIETGGPCCTSELRRPFAWSECCSTKSHHETWVTPRDYVAKMITLWHAPQKAAYSGIYISLRLRKFYLALFHWILHFSKMQVQIRETSGSNTYTGSLWQLTGGHSHVRPSILTSRSARVSLALWTFAMYVELSCS